MKKLSWLKRIKRAERLGYLTIDDISDARGWATCYVGENREKLEKKGVAFSGESRIPKIWSLKRLGFKFSEAIRKGDIKAAKTIMNEIDKYFLETNKKGKK